MELICNDDSNCELEEKIEVKLGDYAIVLVAGKSRSLKFIARIDNYDGDDCEYEGVFLQKVNSKIDSGWEIKEKLLLKMKKMLLHLPLMTLCLYFLLQLLLVGQKEEVINCGLILTLAN